MNLLDAYAENLKSMDNLALLDELILCAYDVAAAQNEPIGMLLGKQSKAKNEILGRMK